MSADLVQGGLVLALVAVAALYLGVRAFRSVAAAARARKDAACGSGCGCAPAGQSRSKARL
jgi:hypothetical protein